MKRARRWKETTRKNPQYLTNYGDETDEIKDLFAMLLLDLKLEVLSKLRAKDAAKLVFVSDLWSSIARRKDFNDMYMARSSIRPRLLFLGYGKGMQFFDSCSQKDPSSDHLRVKMAQGPRYIFSQPVRGLICCRHKGKVMVGNPSTGQFLTLPRVKNSWGKNVVPYFGYDPVNDVYKVLCMTLSSSRFSFNATLEQHQVLSIGGGGAIQKWRMLKCNLLPHHLIRTDFRGICNNGICINGVVYYLAYANDFDYGPVVIIFDVKSEEFNVAKFPSPYLPCSDLVNHNGKVALGPRIYTNTLDVWVLEDASQQKWSKTSYLVPCWADIAVFNKALIYKGTLSTGELILAPMPDTNPFFLVYYDSKEDNVKKVVIKGPFSDIRVFLDHVESPTFLSK